MMTAYVIIHIFRGLEPLGGVLGAPGALLGTIWGIKGPIRASWDLLGDLLGAS